MCMSYVLHRRTWGILSLMIGFNLHQSRASDIIALIFKLIVFSFVGGDEYLSSCGQRKSKADGRIKVVRVHIKCYNLIKNKKTIKSHKRECLSSPLFKTVIRLPKQKRKSEKKIYIHSSANTETVINYSELTCLSAPVRNRSDSMRPKSSAEKTGRKRCAARTDQIKKTVSSFS